MDSGYHDSLRTRAPELGGSSSVSGCARSGPDASRRARLALAASRSEPCLVQHWRARDATRDVAHRIPDSTRAHDGYRRANRVGRDSRAHDASWAKANRLSARRSLTKCVRCSSITPATSAASTKEPQMWVPRRVVPLVLLAAGSAAAHAQQLQGATGACLAPGGNQP